MSKANFSDDFKRDAVSQINACAQALMRATHGVSQERCDALALVFAMRCAQDGIDPGILLENTLIKFWR